MSSIMPDWQPYILHYGEGGTLLLRDPAILMTMFNATAMDLNDDGDISLLVYTEEGDGMEWREVSELTLPAPPTRN